MSELAATYENFDPPESVKLWRRDWENMPNEAFVRLKCEEDGRFLWGMVRRNSQGEIVEDYPSGFVRIGWYPVPNPHSDAAYGDPGEGLGS